MGEMVLYTAVTLDGCIAREDGSLDWLTGFPNPDNTDYGYQPFLEGIDTLLMGRKTYDELLGFGIEWPYANCRTFVASRNSHLKVSTAATFTLNKLDTEELNGLKRESRSAVWLVGGGEIVVQCLNLGVVDKIILSIIPVILGKGIRLFPSEAIETGFVLEGSEVFGSGVVNLAYRKMKP